MNQRINKLIIHKTELLYFIVIMIYLSPGYLQTISLYHRLWQGICAVLSLYFIISYIHKPKWFLGFTLIALFYISVLLSTIINHGQIVQFMIIALIGIGFAAMTIHTFSSDTLQDYVLNAFIIALEVYVVINFLTVVLMPEGLYRVYGYNLDWASNPAYLLGHRNNAIEYFLPLIGLIGVKSRKNNLVLSKNLIFIIVVSLATSLLTWSVNAMLCIAFLVISLVIYNRKGIIGYTLPILLGASAIASFVLINIELNPFIQNIVVNVFHKSTNLSGRTRIWGKALLSIRESPIWGHGIQENLYNYVRLTTVGSTHNYFLDFLYWGGLICLIITLLYIFYINRIYRKGEKTVENYCNIFYGTYFILWIATPIHKENMFLMFAYFIATALVSLRIDKSSMSQLLIYKRKYYR